MVTHALDKQTKMSQTTKLEIHENKDKIEKEEELKMLE